MNASVDGNLSLPSRRGWLHANGPRLLGLFRLIDLAWVFAGLALAAWLLDRRWTNDFTWHALLAAIALQGLAGYVQLYRSWRIQPLREELGRMTVCWLGASSGISMVLLVASPSPIDERWLFASWSLLWGAGFIGTRVAVRVALRVLRVRGRNYRVAAIVGANALGSLIAARFRGTAWMGVRVAGYFDDRCPADDRVIAGASIEGTFADLVERVREGTIDVVYITLPMRAERRVLDLVDRLRDSTATVAYVPDFAAFGLLGARWDVVDGVPIVSLLDTPHQGVSALSKRVFDVAVAGLIVGVAAIPMACIAAAIRLTSPGPAVFRQKRYGLDGRPFEIWKFRTMTTVEDGETSFSQARRGDSRVTSLGAFLRRTSLDELPQFINVLQGSMSIVGPRPHPIALNESHRARIAGYMLRHKVKPGITGWAQVNGFRGETDTLEKMRRRIECDLEYIDRWSLLFDVRILLLTLRRVWTDSNAF